MNQFVTIAFFIIMAWFSFYALTKGLKKRDKNGNLDLDWYNLRFMGGGLIAGLGVILTILKLIFETKN